MRIVFKKYNLNYSVKNSHNLRKSRISAIKLMVKSSIFGLNYFCVLMRNFLLFISFLFTFYSVHAQYTDVINANRPGVSEGAFSVGRDVLQLEMGLNLGKENHSLLERESTNYGVDYTLRYGILSERLELRWTGEFLASDVIEKQFVPNREYPLSNFRSNVLGVKYLIYDPHIARDLKGPNLYSWRANNKFQWADLIPAISLFAGINLDLDKENPYLPPNTSAISPKVVLSTQNNFKGGWVLVTNIIGDRLATDFPSYSYIVTLTHYVGNAVSIFAENQGIKSDFYADQLIRGGGAILLNRDFQLDLSVTYSFKDTPSILYGRLGVAYRFDMHTKDDYLEEMDPTKSREERRALREGRQRDSNDNDTPQELIPEEK